MIARCRINYRSLSKFEAQMFCDLRKKISTATFSTFQGQVQRYINTRFVTHSNRFGNCETLAQHNDQSLSITNW